MMAGNVTRSSKRIVVKYFYNNFNDLPIGNRVGEELSNENRASIKRHSSSESTRKDGLQFNFQILQ